MLAYVLTITVCVIATGNCHDMENTKPYRVEADCIAAGNKIIELLKEDFKDSGIDTSDFQCKPIKPSLDQDDGI